MNRRHGWILRALLAAGLVAMVGLAASRVIERLEPLPPPQRPPLPVLVETVLSSPFRVTRSYVGTVEAERRVAVSPRVAGVVAETFFREGDSVDAGAQVARLEAAELEQEAARLEAAVERARSELAFWERQLERDRALYAEKRVAERNLDDSRRQVAALTAALHEQKAAASAARIRLGYTTLSAPFAGQVQRVVAEAGTMVNPGQAVLELVDLDRLKAVFPLPQADLGEVGKGQRVLFPGRPELPAGRISRVYPALETATRTATFEVELPTGTALRPGMRLRAAVVLLEEPAAISVPSQAVHRRDGRTGVFLLVAGAGVARWREVDAGRAAEGRVQVGGLAVGDQVIITPHPALRDGLAVSPGSVDGGIR